MLRLQPRDVAVGGGDRIHPAREQAVDPAQHGVLLMDHARHAGAGRGPQRGEGRIAAKADHGGRLEAFEQAQRHAPSFQDCLNALGPVQRVLAQPPGGQDMGDQRMGLARQPGAALVSDQRDMVAAPLQFHRQRKGRDQVPARAPGGEDVVTADRAHLPSPNFSSENGSRRINGLRRVMAIRKPTPRHSAMVDEPP